jgi:hypothetical protein
LYVFPSCSISTLCDRASTTRLNLLLLLNALGARTAVRPLLLHAAWTLCFIKYAMRATY